MSIDYTEPEEGTEETGLASDSIDECPWKTTVYEEGDHHADDVEYIPDDIL